MNELLKPIDALVSDVLPSGLVSYFLSGYLYFTRAFASYYADYMLFLLFFVLLYYVVPRQWRVIYLLAASISLVFYMYGGLFIFGFLAVPLLIFHLVFKFHERALHDVAFRKKATGILIAAILIIYFALLFREGYNQKWNLSVMNGRFLDPVLHFCGVAYVVPKLIQYVSDCLRGEIEPAPLSRFALFVVFFPTLRMGPIARFENFNNDIDNLYKSDPTWKDIGTGAYRIGLGLIKAIANVALIFYLAYDVSSLDAIRQQTWIILYWTLILNVFSVYLYFSSYSDIAIGFSRLLGFHMPENFYIPFLSENLGVWWRRWHMSLSFWLRDYVYIPLGGSKHKALRNVFITFIACGAWHALSLNYIVWGIGQAIGLVIWFSWHRFWRNQKKIEAQSTLIKSIKTLSINHPKLITNLSRFITFNYFCLVGIYFIFEFERANYYFLRFITFGFFR